MEAIVQDIKLKNNYHVMLPVVLEDLQAFFTETFGECSAQTEEGFLVVLLSTDYYEEEVTLELLEANRLANQLEEAESEYGIDNLIAFFEYYSYNEMRLLEDIEFWRSREDYIDSLYETYGLSEMPFLWTTVDVFLDDNDVFEQILTAGAVYEARNGVIVDCP